MDIILIILAVICLITGIIGCALPILPGPPLSWVGLLLLKFTDKYSDRISLTWIIIWAVIVLIITVLDYLIPIWGTKKMGGTKAGVWGATLGMIAGLFFPPWGIIAGPFVGALIGEMMFGKNQKQSFKAAFGSFLGFLTSMGIKLLVCGLIAGHFIIIVLSGFR
ncbi:MAG: DUF456 domain-containing protein [Candidatus Azobacteroides sp.]|nr:DUF456 domain-containing protein [Candidatus Azobacteroides sp.]